jgi:Carboxypeptidase regulatory-like domain
VSQGAWSISSSRVRCARGCAALWATLLRGIAFLAVLLGLCSEIHVLAQSANASLTGRITDASKAVVADAKVIVINTSTRIRYESFTNQTGSYYVTNLTPGTYRIEAERLGFKAVIKSDVILTCRILWKSISKWS